MATPRLLAVVALVLVVVAACTPAVRAGAREQTSTEDFVADAIAKYLRKRTPNNSPPQQPQQPGNPPQQPQTPQPQGNPPGHARLCNSLFDAREATLQMFRTGAAGNLSTFDYEAEKLLLTVANAGIANYGCCSAPYSAYWVSNYALSSGPVCGFDFQTYQQPSQACAVGVYHAGSCFGRDTNLPCYYLPTFQQQVECILGVTLDLAENVNVANQPPDIYLLAQVPPCVGNGYDNTVYRQSDGSCNNVGAVNYPGVEIPGIGPLNFRYSGMAGNKFTHEWSGVNQIASPSEYITSGPNPREISVRLFSQNQFIPNPVNANGLAMAWINFFVHDFMNHANFDWQYPYYVPLPEDDPLWGSFASMPGNPTSLYMIVQGTIPSNDWVPGQGFPIRRNAATAWFDLSQLYGADAQTTASLRAFQGGLLRMNSGPLGDMLPDDPLGVRFVKYPFLSGDYRVNFHPGLTAMTTVWAREHNHIATRLAQAYPSMTDEELFQTARLITSREFVQVHEAEWSNQMYTDPADQAVTLGLLAQLTPNTTVNPFATLATPEEFVANYKWHTFVNPYLTLRDNTGNVIPGGSNINYLAQFQDTTLIRTYGISPVIVGLATAPCGIQRFHNVPPAMQNMMHPFLVSSPLNLFSYPTCQVVPVFDFIATDILRDRERGMPKYNAMRQLVGQGNLPLAEYFDDLADSASDAATLADLYQWDINNVDAFVGSHGEHLYANQGFPLTMVAAFVPFVLARVSLDRFYTADFTPQKYTEWGMERLATVDFAQILCDTGTTCNIPNRGAVFHVWDVTQMGTQTITPS